MSRDDDESQERARAKSRRRAAADNAGGLNENRTAQVEIACLHNDAIETFFEAHLAVAKHLAHVFAKNTSNLDGHSAEDLVSEFFVRNLKLLQNNASESLPIHQAFIARGLKWQIYEKADEAEKRADAVRRWTTQNAMAQPLDAESEYDPCDIEAVRVAFLSLSQEKPKLYFVLYYFFVREIPQKEIAAMLNVCLKTVYNRKKNGLKSMRKLLRPLSAS